MPKWLTEADVFGLLIRFVTDPRAWLGVAAVLLCSGLLTGYAAEQRLAERLLAEKRRMPEPVLVQALDLAALSSGESEVSILGEVDFSQGEVVDSEDGTQLFLLPVYAVSSGGKRAALVRMYEVLGAGVAPQSHRPVPRASASEQPRASAVLAIEVTIDESTPSNLGDLGLRELRQGFHGSVVHAEGVLRNAPASREEPGGVMTYAATGTLPIIEPIAMKPDLGMERAEPSAVSALQLFLGFLILTTALMLLVWRRMAQSVPKRPKSPPQPAMERTALATPEAFSPIASQDELFETLKARSESDQLAPTILATAKKRISRLVAVRSRH